MQRKRRGTAAVYIHSIRTLCCVLSAVYIPAAAERELSGPAKAQREYI
jgi:hypothetical protein